MAAVASPALWVHPRAASPSAPSSSASPRCRFSSFAYSYSKFAKPFPIQSLNGCRMQHFGTVKGDALRSISNHDGRFHISRIISLAAMDKQDPLVSPTSDTPVSEDTERSTNDAPVTDSSSYFTDRGGGKPGFISFQGGSYQKTTVESVPHPGKEASRLVWFVGPTILVSFLVLPSLYLRKVLSAVFEDSLLTDFLILFFTETLFYGGVAIFVMLIDKVWRPLQQVAPKSHLVKIQIFSNFFSNNNGSELDNPPFDNGHGLAMDWTSSISNSCALFGRTCCTVCIRAVCTASKITFLASYSYYLQGIQASPTEQGSSAGDSTHIFC